MDAIYTVNDVGVLNTCLAYITLFRTKNFLVYCMNGGCQSSETHDISVYLKDNSFLFSYFHFIF